MRNLVADMLPRRPNVNPYPFPLPVIEGTPTRTPAAYPAPPTYP